jgi:hypothetical protein
LIRLKERISELHQEIDVAKEDFKFLHRERGLLTKERENQQQDIEVWSARCRELQMLKFGKEIDLDELEANSDRTKEREAEALLKEDGEKFKMKSMKLFRATATLEEQLAQVRSGGWLVVGCVCYSVCLFIYVGGFFPVDCFVLFCVGSCFVTVVLLYNYLAFRLPNETQCCSMKSRS